MTRCWARRGGGRARRRRPAIWPVGQASAHGASHAQRRAGRSARARRLGGFGGEQADREVVAQFDKDGDSRLDSRERNAAREWLASQAACGPADGAAAAFGGRSPGAGAPGRSSDAGRRQVRIRAPPLYDPATLRTIFLQFENADWEAGARRLQRHRRRGAGDDRPSTARRTRTSASTSAACRRSAMVPAGSKRSLNLSFDFVARAAGAAAATTRSTC